MSRSGATALVVLASVLLVGATVTGYARLAFFNSGQFADRASAALAQPAVRDAIGERVTDEIVLRNDADLIAARPLIASTVSGVVGGSAFRTLFRGAVLDAHRAIFTGDRDTLTLTLADVGTVVAAALEKLNPQLAADLDAGTRVVILKRDIGSLTGDVGAHRRALEGARVGAGGADAARRSRRAGHLPRPPAHVLAARRGRRLRRRLHRRRRTRWRARCWWTAPRPACGTPTSATCGPSAGCSQGRVRSSPRRRRR